MKSFTGSKNHHYNHQLMQPLKKILRSWGRYLSVRAEVYQPHELEQIRLAVTTCAQVTPRGNARSYGDASLGREVVDMTKYNQIVDFEVVTGTVECQSGVQLSKLIPAIVAKGWFLAVTPGIKSITIGGAIASNVHGKNHPARGCFSDIVLSFELMHKDGSIVICSRAQHTDLFYATFGAMGSTGLVLSAKLKLQVITSTMMEQTTITGKGLTSLLASLWDAPTTYAATWLDLTNAFSPETIRYVLFCAEHSAQKDTKLRYDTGIKLSVPFTPPYNLLTNNLMRLYNRYIWNKNQNKQTSQVSLDQYFYPLDSLKHWNRLYGPRGFYQYQFCVPKTTAEACFLAVFELIQTRKQKPYLCVMKRHAAQNEPTPNSFPIEGFSLAMDFPVCEEVEVLITQLDEIVWQANGKIYLSKDARSRGRMSRLDINSIRKHNTGFGSMLFDRISSDL
jgi:decaprenylphospho-beta-D-ribofuranose 2-oxidase